MAWADAAMTVNPILKKGETRNAGCRVETGGGQCRGFGDGGMRVRFLAAATIKDMSA